MIELSKKKLKKFLVVSFNQTNVEILHARSFLEGIQILAYDVYPFGLQGYKDDKVIDFIAKFLKKYVANIG